ALAAFEVETPVAASEPAADESPRPARRAVSMAWRIAAAVLVAAGAFAWLARRDAAAATALSVAGMGRADASGLVTSEGPRAAAPGHTATGRDAASLRRALGFFGGLARPVVAAGRVTSARYWRPLRLARQDEAVAPGRGSESDGVPALRFDLAAGRVGRAAW